MKKSFVAVGSILLLQGLILLFVANWNIGVFLNLAMGAVFLVWGINFHEILRRADKNKNFRIAKRIFTVLFSAHITICLFLVIFGGAGGPDFNEDAIVVLGAGVRGDEVSYTLQKRLDKALEYHELKPKVKIVVSGGKGPQEDVTEAYAMEKYLVEKGVPKDLIIKEERATSTRKNFIYSRLLLTEEFGEDVKIAIVTNRFHMLRAVWTAEEEGFVDPSELSCKSSLLTVSADYLREALAIVKFWLFD